MNTSKNTTLYIINTSDEPNNVIFGHANFAQIAGFEPIFVFPSRLNSENNESYYLDYKTIRLNFIFKVYNPFVFIISLIKFIFYITKMFAFKKNAKNFLAIDLLGTLACCLLKIRGINIYTLLNDNFSARYKLSAGAFYFLRSIEANVIKYISNSCIFPDKSRYELLGAPKIRNLYFLPNILKDDYAPVYKGSDKNSLVVMFCGWLDSTRGIELLMDIVQGTSEKIKFVLVGFGNNDLLKSLAKNKRITYLGHLTRNENLLLMSTVDLNIALYNPDILINRYALPQKVYDSLMIGCPLILNSEVKMSGNLHSHGSCFKVNYFDVNRICQIINSLKDNKAHLQKMSVSMRAYYNEFSSFKKNQSIGKNIYNKIFSEINF